MGIVKTQKSNLLQSFVFSPLDFTDLQNYTAVVDMGFCWRLCKPTAEDREKEDETKCTWADYANKVFFTIMNWHLNAKMAILVNDPYDVIDSAKAEEHVRRNCIYGSKNVYIKAIDEFPNKTNLPTFFVDKSNKVRLQNYLTAEFQKLSQSFPGKELTYSIQRNCEDLKTGINIPSYECYHQEADTIVFYIIHAIRQTGNHNTIIIDAEDTDVIVLSSLVSHIESGVLGIRRKKSSFYYNKLFSIELAPIIVQLNVLTGSDSTSGFFERGKNVVVKNVLKIIEDAKLLLDDLGCLREDYFVCIEICV